MPSISPERKSALKSYVIAEIEAAGSVVKKNVRSIIQREPVKTDLAAASQKIKPANCFIKKNKTGFAVKKFLSWPKNFLPAVLARFFGVRNFFRHWRYFGRILLWFKRKYLKWTAMVVVLVAVLIAMDAVGIYKFGWHDPFSRLNAWLWRWPAATVEGQKITLADYWRDLSLLRQSIENRREGVAEPMAANQSIATGVFYRLLANLLIEKDLAASGIRVSADETEQYLNDIAAGFSQREDLVLAVRKFYGLNLKQFKDKVIQPLIARQKLREKIMADDQNDFNQSARKRAEEILRLALSPGSDFKYLASKYTEDESGINTMGDLGWMAEEKIGADWGRDLFAAQAGSVYPKLIKTLDGYHIFKIDAKLRSDENGEESVKLSHILIKIDVDGYIKSLLDQAEIKKFISFE